MIRRNQGFTLAELLVECLILFFLGFLAFHLMRSTGRPIRGIFPPLPPGPVASASRPMPGPRHFTSFRFRPVATASTVLAEETNPLQEELHRALFAKYESPAYLEWKGKEGIPRDIQKFPEEARIKELRATLAGRVFPASGTEVLVIPPLSFGEIRIDGVFDEPGWGADALEYSIGLGDFRVALLMMRDENRLYLGCEAYSDRTVKGYDQFRFFFHPVTTGLIVNERIHVGTGEGATAIRQTNLKWRRGVMEGSDERWKKHPVNDWNILAGAQGASRMDDHRTYEAALDIAEAGLPRDTPFAFFVEVESDPLLDERGKFRQRVHLGEWGSQQTPIWATFQAPP